MAGTTNYAALKIRTLVREFARFPCLRTWREFSREKKLWDERTGTRKKSDFLKWMLRTWMGRGYEFKEVNRHFRSALDEQKPFARDDLNSKMLENLRISMLDLLHYEDRNSMAHSIETRLPYLDYRLVDFAFSLPHTYKIRGGQTKWLLHKVAREILPARVYGRTDKMGFSTPGQAWFQRPDARERFQHLFSRKDHPLFGFISERRLSKLRSAWKHCEAGQSISFTGESGLWRLLTTAAWLEMLEDSSWPESMPAEEETGSCMKQG